MPKTIHFHLDENCNRAIAEGLKRHGVNVTTTPEAGLLGASDEMQAASALFEGRVIFTQDRDFLRLNAASPLHSGFVYCVKNSRGTGEIIRGLVLIWELYDPEEIAGRVEYL